MNPIKEILNGKIIKEIEALYKIAPPGLNLSDKDRIYNLAVHDIIKRLTTPITNDSI